MKYSDEVWQEALTYKKYINFFVSKYRNFYGLQRCDLIQEALIEACNAIVHRKTKYNTISFRGYLRRCILNRLRDYKNQCGTLIRHGRGSKDHVFEYSTFDRIEYQYRKNYINTQQSLSDIFESVTTEDKQFLVALLNGVSETKLSSLENISRQAINKRKQMLFRKIREL